MSLLKDLPSEIVHCWISVGWHDLMEWTSKTCFNGAPRFISHNLCSCPYFWGSNFVLEPWILLCNEATCCDSVNLTTEIMNNPFIQTDTKREATQLNAESRQWQYSVFSFQGFAAETPRYNPAHSEVRVEQWWPLLLLKYFCIEQCEYSGSVCFCG